MIHSGIEAFVGFHSYYSLPELRRRKLNFESSFFVWKLLKNPKYFRDLKLLWFVLGKVGFASAFFFINIKIWYSIYLIFFFFWFMKILSADLVAMKPNGLSMFDELTTNWNENAWLQSICHTGMEQ